MLLKPIASRLGQALDTRLYGNATGCPEKIEHLVAPQVDPRLHPKLHGALRHRLEQLAPRKKNLVDEVDVGNSGGNQSVELG